MQEIPETVSDADDQFQENLANLVDPTEGEPDIDEEADEDADEGSPGDPGRA